MPPSGRAGRHDSKHGATQSPMKGPAPRRAALHSHQRRADHPPSRPAFSLHPVLHACLDRSLWRSIRLIVTTGCSL
eukprot:COSAG02_NODE_15383_length_1175_cov_1.806691_2_plen_75_part_01